MRPVIGMPICLDDRGRWRSGRTYHYVDASYASALVTAGALPLYLPLSSDPGAFVQKIDGLLLPGGDDIPPPVRYPAHVHFDPTPEDQLEFDRALLDAARGLNLPILGICYGAQLLVLREGGALHYDIASRTRLRTSSTSLPVGTPSPSSRAPDSPLSWARPQTP